MVVCVCDEWMCAMNLTGMACDTVCECHGSLADLGFFRGGDFGNPSERSERALRGCGLT